MVKLQKQLASMFSGAEMSLNISPDESIAIGAAVQVNFTILFLKFLISLILISYLVLGLNLG